jgi:carboxyl-terminal processing protease
MKKFMMATVVGTLAGGLLATQVAGPLLAQEADQRASVYEQLDLFGDIFERIRAQYVEEVNSEAELIEAAINGMLTSLDPHSSYLSANDFADMRVQTRGEFGGLGIEVTQEERLRQGRLADGRHARGRRRHPGRRLHHPCRRAERARPHARRGGGDDARPRGLEIIITVCAKERPSRSTCRSSARRSRSQAVRSRLEGDTVVLRLTTFNEQTFPNLEAQIAEGDRGAGGIENVNGFVIDLRNNPGGLLDQAIRVSPTPSSTRARSSRPAAATRRTPNASTPPWATWPRASRSWCSSTAARPRRRRSWRARSRTIAGPSSSAPELRQGLRPDGHPVQRDGAMRLTTARYYTPSGRSIQALGVSPDVVVEQPPVRPVEETEEEPASAATGSRSEGDLRGALSNDSLTEDERSQIEADRAKAEESARLREEDYQLAYAIDILKGLSALAPAQE